MQRSSLFAFTAVMFGGILFTAVYAGWIWNPFKRRKSIVEYIRDIQVLREVALDILRDSPDKFNHALEMTFKNYAWHTLQMEGIPPDNDLQKMSIRDATKYVIEEFAKDGNVITESNIRTLHAHISKYDDPTIAGQFRSIDVYVPAPRTSFFHRPRHFIAPPYADVPRLMNEFIDWLNDQQPERENLESQLLFAIEAKRRLVTVHPFADGNGRATRALMTGWLCKLSGFPYVTIPTNTKREYFSALNDAQVTDGTDVFVKFALRMIEESFERFLQYLSNLEVRDLSPN